MRKITIKQLINAIRKNGYPQAFGTLWKNKDGEDMYDDSTYRKFTKKDIGAACAMGQARINLRLMDSKTWEEFWHSMDTTAYAMNSNIINMNDGLHMSLAEIADQLEKEYADRFDVVLWEKK